MKLVWVLLLGCLVATPLRAAIKTEVVKYQAGDVECQGYLAYDEQGGKRPGVLVAPEFWGLTEYSKHRAEQLAGLGYVAFAMDPYGDGKTTEDARQAGQWAGALKKDVATLRTRAKAALKVLEQNQKVEPGKVAAIGYCFGGTTALELARSGAPLLGVVSFHGSLATPNSKDARNIKGKVLICHGGDDKFESPEEIAEFQQSMRDAKVDWQMDVYGGAVHSFTNPGADKHGIPSVAYNAAADRRSWVAMKNFFHEIFGESSEGPDRVGEK